MSDSSGQDEPVSSRKRIRQLIAEGHLVQAGWYCNQAMGASERHSLCSHDWPCGPTYVVAAPREDDR